MIRPGSNSRLIDFCRLESYPEEEEDETWPPSLEEGSYSRLIDFCITPL